MKYNVDLKSDVFVMLVLSKIAMMSVFLCWIVFLVMIILSLVNVMIIVPLPVSTVLISVRQAAKLGVTVKTVTSKNMNTHLHLVLNPTNVSSSVPKTKYSTIVPTEHAMKESHQIFRAMTRIQQIENTPN